MSRLLRRFLDGVRSWSARSPLLRPRALPTVEPIEERVLLSGNPIVQFDVSSLTTGGQRSDGERTLARAEDGTFAVVWDAPGSAGLYLRVYDSTGTARSDPVAVAGTDNLSSQVTIGVNGSGSQFVVAWAHNGDIRAQRFAKDGTRVGSVIDVAATTAAESAPSVAVDDWGNFNVAYVTQNGTDSNVVVKRFDKTGVLQGAALIVGNTTAAESDPAIAVSPAGFTVVTWTTQTSTGNRDIHAQRIDYRGNLVGGRLTLAGTPEDESQASVTVDRNGHFVVAYARASGGQSDILVRRYAATGSFRNAVSVTSTATTNEFGPSIAGTRDGAFSVAWTAQTGSGASQDLNVLLQSYNGSGVALGEQITIAGSTTQDERAPSIGVDAGGTPVGLIENLDTKGGTGAVYAWVFGSSSFSITDASLDDTTGTVFRDSAARINYEFNPLGSTVTSVKIEAILGAQTITLGTYTSASLSDRLINLASISGLSDGTYQVRATATLANGKTLTTQAETLRVLGGTTAKGNFTADTLKYTISNVQGAVFLGSGGTDVLDLGVSRSLIVSLNGLTLAQYNPATNSTVNQAIFKGSAYDYLRLSDGRELYVQGIERLKFADGTFFEMVIKPNDPMYASQWNLHVSDVVDAWRFTQGNSGVLLVSLDTGILTAVGAQGGINDITTTRLLLDASDDDNYADYGHGHSAISVMIGTANNGAGITGINSGSTLLVNDVYNGVSLQQAMTEAIAYAKARGMKVVFQGGMQGEYWLNSGGTQAQLEKLLSDNEGIVLLEVAAGNGNVDINATIGVDPVYSGGLARLQNNHANVISVGALQRTGTTANGLSNAGAVNRASYSNYGSALTLMAATDVPVVDKYGKSVIFYGTSAANPNVAGIASLVWSANTSLTGNQVRQILTETAIDLGAAGRDNTFGAGLINADTAVRRAVALGRAADVANLYTASGAVSSGGTSAPGGAAGGTVAPSLLPPVEDVFTAPTTSSVPPAATVEVAADEPAGAYWANLSQPATGDSLGWSQQQKFDTGDRPAHNPETTSTPPTVAGIETLLSAVVRHTPVQNLLVQWDVDGVEEKLFE